MKVFYNEASAQIFQDVCAQRQDHMWPQDFNHSQETQRASCTQVVVWIEQRAGCKQVVWTCMDTVWIKQSFDATNLPQGFLVIKEFQLFEESSQLYCRFETARYELCSRKR